MQKVSSLETSESEKDQVPKERSEEMKACQDLLATEANKREQTEKKLTELEAKFKTSEEQLLVSQRKVKDYETEALRKE